MICSREDKNFDITFDEDTREESFKQKFYKICSDSTQKQGKLFGEFRAFFTTGDTFTGPNDYTFPLVISGYMDEVDRKIEGFLNEVDQAWNKRMTFRSQTWYKYDAIRCFPCITLDTMSRCEIDPGEAIEFFRSRWSQSFKLKERREDDIIHPRMMMMILNRKTAKYFKEIQ
jgi:hypothetical protein